MRQLGRAVKAIDSKSIGATLVSSNLTAVVTFYVFNKYFFSPRSKIISNDIIFRLRSVRPNPYIIYLEVTLSMYVFPTYIYRWPFGRKNEISCSGTKEIPVSKPGAGFWDIEIYEKINIELVQY